MHNIQLGSEVITNDGKAIGTVDQVVVDPSSRQLVELIVRQTARSSFLSLEHDNRIVEMNYVDSVDDQGRVHLKISEAQATRLRQFVKEKFLTVQSGIQGRTQHLVPAYDYNVEVKSDISPDMLIVKKGTDVVDVDQNKVGVFDELQFGDDGVVTGIVVLTGKRHHHKVHILVEQLAGVGTNYIRLALSGEVFAQLEASAETAES